MTLVSWYHIHYNDKLLVVNVKNILCFCKIFASHSLEVYYSPQSPTLRSQKPESRMKHDVFDLFDIESIWIKVHSGKKGFIVMMNEIQMTQHTCKLDSLLHLPHMWEVLKLSHVLYLCYWIRTW